MKALLALLLMAACGGGSTNNTGPDASKSIDAAKPADAKIFMDAPPVVNAMITVSGTASDSGQTTSTPLAGVVVGFYLTSNPTTAVATKTTDATGTYSFSIPTSGMVVNGFIKATKSGFTDNYLYPSEPLQADFPMADSNLVSTSDFSGLTILTGQMSSNGFIAATVVDSTGANVMGAKVTSTPASGSYAYSDSNGIPTSTTGTNTDGRAFFINVPPGAPVAITATKTGTAFKSTTLTGHAGALTTTLIAP